MIAVITDARLIKERLDFEADLLLNSKDSTGAVTVEARSSVQNSLLGRMENSPSKQQSIVVEAILTVVVRRKDQPVILVEYQSTYRVTFNVISGSLDDVDTAGPDILVPYIAHTNWLATRRADGSLAATGIANLRLKAPAPALGQITRDDAKSLAANISQQVKSPARRKTKLSPS